MSLYPEIASQTNRMHALQVVGLFDSEVRVFDSIIDPIARWQIFFCKSLSRLFSILRSLIYADRKTMFARTN